MEFAKLSFQLQTKPVQVLSYKSIDSRTPRKAFSKLIWLTVGYEIGLIFREFSEASVSEESNMVMWWGKPPQESYFISWIIHGSPCYKITTSGRWEIPEQARKRRDRSTPYMVLWSTMQDSPSWKVTWISHYIVGIVSNVCGWRFYLGQMRGLDLDCDEILSWGRLRKWFLGHDRILIRWTDDLYLGNCSKSIRTCMLCSSKRVGYRLEDEIHVSSFIDMSLLVTSEWRHLRTVLYVFCERSYKLISSEEL